MRSKKQETYKRDIRWFCAQGEHVDGPFLESDLLTMASWGKLPRTAMVQKEGESDWKPIGEVFTLPEEQAPPPPAPKPEPQIAPAPQPVLTIDPSESDFRKRVRGKPKIKLYSSFRRRAVAYLIDTVILTILFLLTITIGVVWPAIGIPLALYMLLYEIIYTVIWQATPGKRMMGIRLMTLNEGDVGVWRAIGRFLAKVVAIPMTISLIMYAFGNVPAAHPTKQQLMISFIPLGLYLVAYGMAAFTPKKRALHDYVAGTIVVYC